LSAIKSRIDAAGSGASKFKTGKQVIDILESWLMDEEQKPNLSTNAWDIFFLYAASLRNSRNDKPGVTCL
jgi:hypothetical protein